MNPPQGSGEERICARCNGTERITHISIPYDRPCPDCSPPTPDHGADIPATKGEAMSAPEYEKAPDGSTVCKGCGVEMGQPLEDGGHHKADCSYMKKPWQRQSRGAGGLRPFADGRPY